MITLSSTFVFFLLLIGMSLLAVDIGSVYDNKKIILRKCFSIPKRCLNKEAVGNYEKVHFFYTLCDFDLFSCLKLH